MTVELLTASAETAGAPAILTRTIDVPPGAPWDQARAADLEARLGAPLPISELKYKLKRLSSWAPTRSGKFAAFYLKSSEYRAPFETVVRVDGASIAVGFGIKSRRFAHAPMGVATVASIAVMLVLMVVSMGTAISAREGADGLIHRGEVLVGSQSKALYRYRRHEKAIASARVLANGRTSISELLTDLDWAAASRAPDARIQSVHFYQGIFAVESKGAKPPFPIPNRAVTRSDRPVADDIWLWAIGAPSASPEPQR